MPLSSLFDWLKERLPAGAGRSVAKPEVHAADHPKSELTANAEKALHMKREADAKQGSQVPPYQTAHDGMRPANDPNADDATRGAEGGFTPQLKRSRVPRSGDAS